MNRTSFLQTLLSSLVIGKLPVSITQDFRKIYLLQCFVAGFRHYEGMELLNHMQEGDLLELVREPKNEYDDCAIALHWQSKKIGFIPADTNEMLSYLLDAEALSLFATITHLEKNTQPWESVAVAVYFIQEVNKALPAHASYLTRIEAPHYRTLHQKTNKPSLPEAHSMEDLFDASNRIINLDTIPASHQDAKIYFEQHYSTHLVSLDKPGRYVQIKDDGIFSFMYEIDEKIEKVIDKAGNDFLEFFLV